MTFKDLFSGHAADYKTFRPTYPRELFAFLASVAPGHALAWDCATGNGQAARELKPFFERVIATDASREQLSQAEPISGVEFVVAPAEQTAFADASVDLVAVAQALHWFDLPRFYAEMRRVLRPDGVVACWCYALTTISPEIDAVVWKLYQDILDPYWAPERRLVEQRYETISFPFEQLPAPKFHMTVSWRLAQLVGYLNTWSAVREYQQKHGVNPLTYVGDALYAAWGDPGAAREVVWPLHLRLGVANRAAAQ